MGYKEQRSLLVTHYVSPLSVAMQTHVVITFLDRRVLVGVDAALDILDIYTWNSIVDPALTCSRRNW